MSKKLLTASILVLVIGTCLVLTSRKPEFRGEFKHEIFIRDIDKLEYGECLKSLKRTRVKIFQWKTLFTSYDPGTYRFTFILKADNFIHLPQIDFHIVFKNKGIIGVGIKPTPFGPTTEAQATFDNVELPWADGKELATIELYMEFLPEDIEGVVTFRLIREQYVTHIPWLIGGIFLIAIGIITILTKGKVIEVVLAKIRGLLFYGIHPAPPSRRTLLVDSVGLIINASSTMRGEVYNW